MIYLQPTGGLCNRLRAIAAAKAFVRLHNLTRKITVLWVLGGELNCRYDQLFEEDEELNFIHYDSAKKFPSGRAVMLGLKRKFFCKYLEGVDGPERLDPWIDRLQKGKDVWIKTSYQFIASPIDYSFFHPKKRYVKKAADLVKSENVVGIHIRRGDNRSSIKESPLILFENKMREELNENPSALFFIATDSPEDEDRLKSRFGSSVVFQPNKDLRRDSPQGIQDALVDLLCLARCRKIYGSFWSSFSQVASYMGRNELEILHIH